MLRLRSALTIASVFAMALAACSDESNTTSTPTTPTPTDPGTTTGETATLRVVHASPDAPAVDVYVEGIAEPVLKGVKFGDASPYLTVPAGKANIQLRAAGSPSSAAPAYSTGPLEIPAKAKITAVAAGLLSATDDASKLRVLALAENFKSASDKATVRIVHASADAPTVGVDVGNDDPSKPEVASLARFADTGVDGVQLPADTELQIGIAAGGARVTSFTTPKLPAGQELFVIATGLTSKAPRDAAGFSLLAVGPTGALGFVKQNPFVYALHAGPDAPAVDLFVGQTEIADNLAFGQLTGALQVPPGSYTVDFFAHASGSARPSGNPVVSKSTGSLEAGERYLAAATGFLAAGSKNPFTLVAQSDNFDGSDTSKGVVRAWHLSPDAPTVDIGTVSGTSISPVFSGLSFPSASAASGLALAPASYELGLTAAGTTSPILAKFSVPLVAGDRAFAIAAGSAVPAASTPLRLLVVNTSKAPWSVTTVSPK